MNRKLVIFICTICLMTFSAYALDVDATWTSTNWLDVDNWDSNEAPVDGADDATISDGHMAVLTGTQTVSIKKLWISGVSGSSVLVAGNSLLEILSPSCLYVGRSDGTGRLRLQDEAVLNVPETVYVGYGANSNGSLEVVDGIANIRTLTFGAYDGSQGIVNVYGGRINVDYRIYMGNTGGSETSPAITILNILGGEIIFDPNSTGTEYFMVGYNGTGYTINTIEQSGGTVSASYRFHLGDRNNNNVCRYSISNGRLEVADRLANGYYWGSSYGRPVSSFEIIGSKPVVEAGTYYQNSRSTLKATLTEDGVSPINITGEAFFESGAQLEVELKNGGQLYAKTSYDVMIANEITLQGSLVKVGDSNNCWDWTIISENGKDKLRITYTPNVTPSSWQLFDGLVLWLDASNLSSIVPAGSGLQNGDKISAWQDIMAGFNTTSDNAVQNVSVNQPIWDSSVEKLGGKSAIVFDGVDSYMNINSLCIGSETTIFIVAENKIQNSGQSYHRPLLAADNDPYRSNGDGYGIGYTQLSANEFMAFLANGTTTDIQHNIVSMDDNFRIYTVRKNGSSSTELFEFEDGDTNNVLIDDTPVFSRVTSFHTGYDIGAHAGADPQYPRQYLGSIAEIIVFNRCLSVSDIKSVTDYLNDKYFHDLYAVCVDSLDRVFPDQTPAEKSSFEPISLPKGGTAAFQYAVMAPTNGTCKFTILPAIDANGIRLGEISKSYHLETVYVEANTNGCGNTAAGVVPPTSWHTSFTRMAPFNVAEVLVEASELVLTSGQYSAVLIDIEIPTDAVSGTYIGYIQFEMGSEKIKLPYNIRVHDVTLPKNPAMQLGHWIERAPENLTTNSTLPAWWSDEHWRLLRKSGRVMWSFGERSVMTPLAEGTYPLIKTRHDDNGNYTFDYTNFDRWVEMFSDLGFTQFEGAHATFNAVYSWHISTGQRVTVLPSDAINQARLYFLTIFWDALYQHLDAKGWKSIYVQHLIDEPADVGVYQSLHNVFATNMPGMKNIDAILFNPTNYSPMVSIEVLNLPTLAANQNLVNQRLADGNEVWLYSCCSPYPPEYPNRHLDLRLTSGRLYPWLAYFYNAQGYCNWAANRYRGANPYTSSIGPLPDGTQNPGHPVGDSWFYYKSPSGLRGSMRMVAFRDGLQDFTLLKLLEAQNDTAAANIVAEIVRSATDWEIDPSAYHQARTDLLESLDLYN
ncbi:MAG: hypothetical protein A2Y12_14145 [Planctomycetes bacterium GWF2_42_9]|nr:MAG: hypothetical protein A2Y12_14145 [Planctomycetes bacterium GWF2_42_9]